MTYAALHQWQGRLLAFGNKGTGGHERQAVLIFRLFGKFFKNGSIMAIIRFRALSRNGIFSNDVILGSRGFLRLRGGITCQARCIQDIG